MYDCTNDILEHRERVEYWVRDFVNQLTGRAKVHDASKLEEPEKAIFDEWTPNLGKVKYGSKEYQQALRAMGKGLAHHYQANRHHPQHFENGVSDMTLLDLLEMFCDWLAAAERKKTHIDLEQLQERFGLSNQLVKIMLNTLQDIDFWSKAHNAPVPQFSPPVPVSQSLESTDASEVQTQQAVLTIWTTGEHEVWGAVDATIAKADPDYLVTIPLNELVVGPHLRHN